MDLYLVEAYAGAFDRVTPRGRRRAHPEDPVVIGVIDIPADDVVLYLVEALDAESAATTAVGDHATPIRVVPVRWRSTAPP